MKQLIVAAAILPILLAFVAQFTEQNLLHRRLMRAESAIHLAKIEAEAEGGFSSGNASRLRQELAGIMQVSSSEILLELEKNPGVDDKVISYRIGVPSGRIIASGRLFGISNAENKKLIIFEGSIPNLYYYIEKHKPEPPVVEDEEDVSRDVEKHESTENKSDEASEPEDSLISIEAEKKKDAS